MKTVITSSGNSQDSQFDLRFGRTAWFCLYNETTGDVSFFENVYANAQGGAGQKAAEKMVELGVEKVISGDFGPKAKDLLDRFKIQMVIIQDDQITVEEIIQKLKS
ncbi:MAG: NifB/NifX family molybdenum-iron cluster-binding protein [Bacteroidales bacterium]